MAVRRYAGAIASRVIAREGRSLSGVIARRGGAEAIRLRTRPDRHAAGAARDDDS
jgi:hypothetical protein